jgi:hypothetical protein
VAPANAIEEYDQSDGPQVAHVGAGESKIKSAFEAYGNNAFPEVRWFFNYKQDHCLNLDTIHKLSGRNE